MATVETLLFGFPGRSSRGYLGWSAVYLMVTKQGRKILFDTAGYNERATLVAALEQRQIRLDGIHTVVLSHLHFDHAANWDLFPAAEIVVHEKEMERSARTHCTWLDASGKIIDHHHFRQ